MKLRAHHFAAYLFAGALFLSTGTWFAVHTPPAEATCGTGSSVVVTSPSNSSGTTGPLSGIRSFRAYSSPTSASGMTFMIVAPTQKPLGEAIQNGTEWKLDWDTRNIPNGVYQLVAIAHFGTATTLDCASPVTSFTVHNNATQAPKLQATIVPGSWQTPVGTSRTFSVDAVYTDQYGRQSHVAPGTATPPRWLTTIGVVGTEFGPSTVLRSGATAGVGHLKVQISHNGLTALATAEVKVTPPTSPGTAPNPSPSPATSPAPTTTTTGSGTTTDANTRLATMPTIFRPADPTNSAPVVPLPSLSCLEKKVGAARFNEISSGKSEPTAAERRLAAECFSGPAPIPAILAPIAPSGVSGLEQTKDLVTLSGIKNTTITNSEGKKITGVLLSGKGAPNSNVFIYIFSDPLVLRAQTDSQGAWSYVLETPLEPGKHEVYAVAEKDSSTFVRSQAIPVQIAAAADSPDGSLIIERTWSPAQIGFVILAALMVFAGLAVVISLRRRHRQSPATAAAPNSAPQAAAPSPAAPRTTPQVAVPAPGQTFHPTAPKSSAPSSQPSTTGNGPAA